MKFMDEFYFKSVLIKFEVKRKIINLSIIFTSLDGVVIKCGKQMTYWIDNFNLETECDTDSFVTEINITLNSFVSVCGIIVNGGRNIIKESNIVIYSNGQRLPLTAATHLQGVFDDDKDDIGCFTIVEPGKEFIWESTFEWPRVIYQILIYSSGNRITSMHTFKVELYNDENHLVFTTNIESFLLPYKINILKSGRVMKLLIIASDVISLCELEVFGDCTTRYYGPDCDQVCLMSCKNKDCQFTGVCKLCVPGHTGSYCLDFNSTIRTSKKNVENETEAIVSPKQNLLTLDEQVFIIFSIFLVCVLVFMQICSRRLITVSLLYQLVEKHIQILFK
ncbi:uncharacterized protein LOC131940230 isoform X1 [Physella acuta]|uniref:uncharacterized protein LOC131940230 isoform X1 n=1 Tax=Physella acuta TaxID=109671 RepID=UPI0027DD4E06|nr:uncharacterized protein LOC131940230 isoform X1 [Physella acuta]